MTANGSKIRVDFESRTTRSTTTTTTTPAVKNNQANKENEEFKSPFSQNKAGQKGGQTENAGGDMRKLREARVLRGKTQHILNR